MSANDSKQVPPGILEKNILLKLRFDFDQYINLRPVKLYPGVETPLKNVKAENLNYVVVRENTGGVYTGMGGIMMKDTAMLPRHWMSCWTATDIIMKMK